MYDFGFCEQIEGLLGEGNYVPDLLIILREPHEDDNGESQIFWFKGEVAKKCCGQRMESTGTRFYNTYSTLAKKILKTEDDFILQKCAYMNLRPFCGKERTGEEYKSILKMLKKLPLEESVRNAIDIGRNRASCDEEVAKHRMRIIQRAIDGGVKNIITTEDIYSVIKKRWDGSDERAFVMKYNNKDNPEPKDKEFHVCWLGKNKETRLISFWHPSCTLINKGYLTSEELQIP